MDSLVQGEKIWRKRPTEWRWVIRRGQNIPCLQEHLPTLKGVGQACRYTVHCQAGLQHIWGCSMGQLRSHVSVSPLTDNGTAEPLLPSEGFARLGLARAARWRMSVGVPFLTSCPQWDWHSSTTETKMLVPHDNKINVFIRKSLYGRRQQLWGIAGMKSSDQSPAALAGLAPRLVPASLQPLTGTFLFALWSELRVSKMESGSSCLWGVPGAAEHSAFKLKKCRYNLYLIVTIFNQHLIFFLGIAAAGWLFSLSPLHCFSWVVSPSLMASHSSLELRHCCIFMI